MSSKPFVNAIADNILDISGLLNIKCPPDAGDNPGIKFYDRAGNHVHVGPRGGVFGKNHKFTFPNYEFIFPTDEGTKDDVLSSDGSGNLKWISIDTGNKGDRGDPGDPGITGSKGDKGFDGDGGLSLHHETWPIHSEKTTSAITVTNDYIYFQAFLVHTTGDYTNVKFRCYDSTITGAGGIKDSKILAGIYESGHSPASGPGGSPWDSDIGGPGMPWPKNKIADGSKTAFINVGDGHWVDVSFNSSVTLTRNKMYFMAFKAGEDPDAAASWQTIWYGINDVGEEEKMSMVWIRDTDLGNTQWDILPTLSYGSESFGGTTVYHPPIHTDECLWFTVYGSQTGVSNGSGPQGEKGEVGNTGDKGGDGSKGEQGKDGGSNIHYQTWDLANNAFHDQDGEINLEGAHEKKTVYYHAFFPPATGVYNKVEIRVHTDNITSFPPQGLKIYCAIYENVLNSEYGGGAFNNEQAPGGKLTASDLFANIGTSTSTHSGGIDYCDINGGDGITLTKGKLYWIGIKYQDYFISSEDSISFYSSKTGHNNFSYRYPNYPFDGLPQTTPAPGAQNASHHDDATFWFRVTGPSSNSSGSGSKGEKGEVGTNGSDGSDGSDGIDGSNGVDGGINVWYETWDMTTSGGNDNDNTSGNSSQCYYHGFLCDTTGTYNNIKLRIASGTITSGTADAFLSVAIYDSYTTNDAKPQPRNLLTSKQESFPGIFSGNYNDKYIDFSIPSADLSRNNFYFIMYAWAGVGTGSQRLLNLYGSASHIANHETNSMARIRAFGGEGPSIDHLNENQTNTSHKAAFWFTVYGPQTAAGASKGQKGETGVNGSSGGDGDKGQKGVSGSSGSDGDKGQKGVNGSSGGDGDKGQKGEIGLGVDGDKGIAGLAGTDGIDGSKGEIGVKGIAGLAGADGIDGSKGEIGVKGIDGVDGNKGEIGVKGIAGTNGIDGTKGQKGLGGVDGSAASKGEKGIAGIDGNKGEIGVKGIAGTNGIDGTKGQKGLAGVDGSAASKGEKGIPGIIIKEK